MNQKNLLLFLNILHIVIIFGPMCVYFTDNKFILKLVWMELVLIYVGWLLFDGKCILSEIEKDIIKKKDNIDEKTMKAYDKNIINYYAKKFFGLKGDFIARFMATFHWLSLYTMIYVTTNKLGIKEKGISLILYSVVVYNFKEPLF